MESLRFKTLYPDYNVLEKWDTPSFNEQTRTVLDRRLHDAPQRRFFSETQWATLAAVCDRVLPQPERAQPIPIAPWIDAKLSEGRSNGTRYARLPPIRECWRRGLDAIEEEAQARFQEPYARLDCDRQDGILQAMDDASVQSSAWRGLPSKTFMRKVLLPEIVEVYYAHPAAWSEIGFGGPASPRGYVRLAENRRDPWEGEERDLEPVRRARQ